MVLATAGIGAVTGAMKFFEGRKQQRQAQEAINNFQWQELTNPYENLQVSTLGADLQREEASRMTATNVAALQNAGSRSLIGGLGRVQAQNNLMNRQIAVDLDQQQKQIDYAKAGQDVKNQSIIENRQANELAGYGQALYAGQQTKYTGLSDVANAAGMFGQMQQNKQATGGGYTPQVSGIQNNIPTQGINLMGGTPLQAPTMPSYLQ